MRLALSSPVRPFTAPVLLVPARGRHVAEGDALRRLNFVEGRTLTRSAMAVEQSYGDARTALVARPLLPGIVEGLGVAVPDQAEAPNRFVLSPGRGIAATGQDVSVSTARTLALDDLVPLGAAAEAAGNPRGLIVLALRPVAIEAVAAANAPGTLGAFADPCPPDPTEVPFIDVVLGDAAEVTFVKLDDGLAGADPLRAPNVAADAVRALEAGGAEPDYAAVAVPLTLMFVNPDGTVRWHLRAGAARRGGLLPAVANMPVGPLRQSQLEGLVEEAALATKGGWTGGAGATFWRTLPPAGVLPKKAYTSRSFFPATWGQAQAPVPLSQLDAALALSAAMAPFDLDAERDTVKWLVPVPDHLYAPDLLAPPGPPDFAFVRDPLRARVADTLALRAALRAMGATVEGAIDRSAVTDFDAVDDDAVPGEGAFSPSPSASPAPEAFADAQLGRLTAVHGKLDETIFTAVQRAMLDPADVPGAVAPFGVTPFVDEMRRVIDGANDTVDFSFSRVQTEIYRVRQLMLGEEEATKLATFPVLAGLAKGSSEYALSTGLRAQFAALSRDRAAPQGGGAAGTADPILFMSAFTGNFGGVTLADVGRGTFAGEASVFLPADTATAVGDSADALALAVSDDGGGLRFDLDPAAPPARDTGFQVIEATGGFGKDDTALLFGSVLNSKDAFLGTSETAVKTLVEGMRADLTDDVLLAGANAKRTGILRAAPLPGDVRDVRSTTIADRLKTSAALTAKASAVRIKADVIREIQATGLSLDELRAPLASTGKVALLPRATVDAAVNQAALNADELNRLAQRRTAVANTGDGIAWEIVTLPAEDGPAVTGLGRLAVDLRRRGGPISMPLLPALTLAKVLDPDPEATAGDPVEADDEAAFLQAAVATLESVVAFLRKVEARISAVTSVVDAIAAELKMFDDVRRRWSAALVLAVDALDEARHDLRVAESLIAEETARIAARDAERQKILDEAVTFVAYVRPRALAPHRAGDTMGLSLPGAQDDPIPEILADDATLPAPLAAMMEAVREMPIGWFAIDPEIQRWLKRPNVLGPIYAGAALRAEAKRVALSRTHAPASRRVSAASTAVASVVAGYRTLTTGVLTARTRIDPRTYTAMSFADRVRRSLSDLSFNDLLQSATQAKVAARTAAEIERIERVLAALEVTLRKTPAALRLLWVDGLSVHDPARSLESLAGLRGWDTLDWEVRNRLTRLVGWLFSRIEPDVKEARALMSDLVRVAVLVAADAPVDEIISARVDRDQAVRKGGAVDIRVRRGTPFVGMAVALFDGSVVAGRGVVRDLQGDAARVELTALEAGIATVTPAFRVVLHAAPSGIGERA